MLSPDAQLLSGFQVVFDLCSMQVAAVTTIGFTEGSSHVNWRVLGLHLMWWFLGFFAVLGVTAALVAQGWLLPCPCDRNLQVLSMYCGVTCEMCNVQFVQFCCVSYWLHVCICFMLRCMLKSKSILLLNPPLPLSIIQQQICSCVSCVAKVASCCSVMSAQHKQAYSLPSTWDQFPRCHVGSLVLTTACGSINSKAFSSLKSMYP